MSIIASLKVYDGVVLGADSASSIQSVVNGQIMIVKSYQNAKKLFHIGKDLCLGVLTYGLGNIGYKSMESFVFDFNKDYADYLKPESPVKEIVQKFSEYIKIHYDSAFGLFPIEQRPILGFYFAGYADGDILAQEWEIIFPNQTEPRQIRDINMCGASWRGAPAPFARLLNGFDGALMSEISTTFGLNQDTLNTILSKYKSQVVYNGMPLQDAIDYVKFILYTTIQFYKFQVGVQICSEPIDIVVITREGYREVKMKEFIA